MKKVSMKEFMPEYMFLNDKEVIKMIVEKLNISEMSALKEFLNSKTYRMCSSVKNSMWDIGSYDIYNMWEAEKNTGSPQNVYFLKGEE